jgi:Cu(I)-responsive transcriptional regulator
MSHPMNIGQAADAAGVSAKMIRNYEALGLIPAAARTDSGYRQYSARDIAALRFIKESRTLGFSTKQIAQLLGLWANTQRESREVKALAIEHIAELDRRIAEMGRMKAALERVASRCRGDGRADCPILGKLSADEAPVRAAHPPVPRVVKPRGEAHERVSPVPNDHVTGLNAWMHGLGRMAAAEHA